MAERSETRVSLKDSVLILQSSIVDIWIRPYIPRLSKAISWTKYRPTQRMMKRKFSKVVEPLSEFHPRNGTDEKR